MNIPFFTDYLMLSNSLSIGIIAVFVLALIGIYVLQRKGTSFVILLLLALLLVPYWYSNSSYCWFS